MAKEKTLKISVNGVCVLSPGEPRDGTPPPQKAYVVMPAMPETKKANAWGVALREHKPFVYVPKSAIAQPVPMSATTVNDKRLGACAVYYLADTRVQFDPPSSDPLRHWIKGDLPLAQQPGSIDVAPDDDFRWLVDMRDISPAIKLKATAQPDAPTVGKEVSVVIDLPGGTITSNFPCKTVQPRTLKDPAHDPVPGFERVTASEFVVTMTYPETTDHVTLKLLPLRAGDAPTGVASELTLYWGKESTIEIRMGNDTPFETELLGSSRRCDSRVRDADGKPVLVPRDDDFELLYSVLDVPPGIGLPIPQNGPHQTHFDGCVPAKV